MDIVEYTKKLYNHYGKEYQKTREEKQESRLYNDFIEVPSMVQAVGDIKGKTLLDIGCGAGIHIKHYLKKGAKCSGLDLSETMIELARKNCPTAEFKIGSMTKLPYDNSFFDIVTASLSIDYIENLQDVFKEVNRVLKKDGLFYYSNESNFASTREVYEDNEIKIKGIGEFIDKKNGKIITLGRAWDDRLVEWEMLPGMMMKTYIKTFRTQLKELRKNGFELVDFIDCKPVPDFKKYNPKGYEVYNKYPRFSIYVSIKK